MSIAAYSVLNLNFKHSTLMQKSLLASHDDFSDYADEFKTAELVDVQGGTTFLSLSNRTHTCAVHLCNLLPCVSYTDDLACQMYEA